MQKVLLSFICLLALACPNSIWSSSLQAQSAEHIIQDFLNEKQEELGLSKTDINNWSITDHNQSKKSGVMHVYIRQNHQGIAISNAIANFTLKDNKVFSMGNRLLANISKKVQYSTPAINPTQAIKSAAKSLNLKTPSNLKSIEALSSKHFIYNTGNISLENIPVQLMYFATQDGDIKLVWDLSIYTLDAQNWWSVRVDAQSGDLIDKNDWVTHCQFDGSPYTNCSHTAHRPSPTIAAPEKMMAPDQYTVFALPLESASHGSRSIVTDPADSIASPKGWHDTDGITGAEYTITRGNNVHAYEDTSSTNSPGYSPDGGPSLEFNFPYASAVEPTVNLDAAITNLFYMNNMIHDVWYRYGFDEASGNFQVNNFGNGGNDGDYVRAEAQDGSGTSNANFATPPDGNRPRMQMFIWPFNTNTGHFLTGNSPTNIAGTYIAIKANFGPSLPGISLTSDLVLLEDVLAPTNDGCDSIINPTALSGKIVLIDQGLCSFVDKIQAAQDAGAIAVIIANTTGFLFTMGGTSSTITIPSIMILAADANVLKTEMQQGPVNVSIDNAGINDKDSDFDNGIIVHEYGHGISNRLTGGPAASNCLRNDEQMGEGWSDWFALMMSIESGDAGSDVRGIGTYVKGEANNGPGIRPAPYSTDFGVNPFTYGNSNNSSISRPHGVGFIFATALWDLNWALINFYGGTPDPDLYNGTGGNNIAMNLIIEGLKLQPCSPGMIDGRDAILQADQLLYNGAHECLIWEVFRNRGFGYSASQGSSASRFDQLEAFDISPVCLNATAAPVAAFTPSSINSCVATLIFTDSSYSTPHTWAWTFGDGGTSTQQNPSYSYSNDGSYTVTLIVSNNIGSDTSSQQINITLPAAPVATDAETCAGSSATITAVGTGEIRWLNSASNPIFEGDTLYIPSVASNVTYFAENMTGPAAQNLGPLDTIIGNHTLDNVAYHGALNFRADQAFEIVSTKVYANGAGPRTFFLSNGTNTDGTAPTSIVDDVSVYLQNGEQIINLNLMVPDSGDYNLGTSGTNLYRNTTGASYPYTATGMMQINSSSSTAAPTDAYYYFYDIKVRTPRCISAKDTAYVNPIVSYFTYVDNNNTFSFTDASVGATSWKWYFGDGDSSTLQNPMHTYAVQGMYTVTLSINGGSCISTQVINDFLSFDQVEQYIPVVRLMPNPTSGIATISLDKALSEDLTIQVSALNGSVLKTANLERGARSFILNMEQLPAGVYVIRIQGLYFSEIRKLIKQ